MSLFKKAIAELIGTLVLVLCGCGTFVVCSKITTNTEALVIVTALAFGLAYMAMSISFERVSGAQFNPAVSLALMLKKKITFSEFIINTLVQMLGATLGVLLLAIILRSNFSTLGGNEIQNILQNNNKLDGYSYIAAFVSELTATGILVMVVLGSCNHSKYSSSVRAFAIGSTITLLHLFLIRITGCSINPARSFGPALLQAFAGNRVSLSQFWIWFFAPLLGSVIATINYSLICDDEEIY